jgi:hypothetical protein
MTWIDQGGRIDIASRLPTSRCLGYPSDQQWRVAQRVDLELTLSDSTIDKAPHAQEKEQ